jgi:Ca2+-binding RTX toxin-like protein
VLNYRGGFAAVDGGAGNDTLDFSLFGSAVWVDLAFNGAEAWTQDRPYLNGGTWREIAEVGNVERLAGTAFDDLLRGDAGANTLFYTGGLDTLDGGGGVDTADFSGFGSAVWVDLTFNGTEAWTRDAADLVAGPWREIADLANIENLVGTVHADMLRGDANANRLEGGAGNDTVTGGGGNDVFVFRSGFGNDVITDFASGPAVGDAIELSLGAAFDTFAEVMNAASQVGADVVFDFGAHGQLTLNNTLLGSLATNDLSFL